MKRCLCAATSNIICSRSYTVAAASAGRTSEQVLDCFYVRVHTHAETVHVLCGQELTKLRLLQYIIIHCRQMWLWSCTVSHYQETI